MVDISMGTSLQERGIRFGVVEVTYLEPDVWRPEAFYKKAEGVLHSLRKKYRDYNRRTVFGEHPYSSRFFKKFKKIYPMML